MDSSTSRTRDLADRARLQPAGRRAARRLRSAAIVALILVACGEKKKDAPTKVEKPSRAAEFRKRFLEASWDDVGEWESRDLVEGLQRYIAGDDPIYSRESKQARALHRLVYRADKDPAGYKPLFSAHDRKEVDAFLQKRDLIGYCVLTPSIRYVVMKEPAARHYDLIAYAGVHFAFDPVYGEAYTHTGAEVGDFFTDVEFRPNEMTAAALRKHLAGLTAQWKRRSTDRATSTFFGIVLRHLEMEGAAALTLLYDGCNGEERLDMVERFRHMDETNVPVRGVLVKALKDESYDVRVAAFGALEAHEAPLDGLDASAREEDIARILPSLEQWAKTQS
ncbi:MAG: hypothetical protein AAF417_23230 [Pseudomonadota bacterium]